MLAYSARNRSASVRIPFSSSPKGKRIEVRFPDPGANPYLAYAALLMAGLDGIENKIDPGAPTDENLYDMAPEKLAKIPHAPHDLSGALDALEKDNKFLTDGGVFNKRFLDDFIAVKRAEVADERKRPTAGEFFKYYDV
jgi:glutamine synthetase